MNYNIFIANANFYNHISTLLEQGAVAALEERGHRYQTCQVPGALELPAAIKIAATSGQFDGYVVLGCVIRGETSHYDIVCNFCNHGLQDLAVHHNLMIGNGVLTVENEAQALIRANPKHGNKGRDAVLACCELLDLKKRLLK